VTKARKRRGKKPPPIEPDDLPIETKAGAVQEIMRVASNFGNENDMDDEHIIAALVIAAVVWTKMALASGRYEISQREAKEELARLLGFAFDETSAEKTWVQ
jgi:hypothetical protein